MRRFLKREGGHRDRCYSKVNHLRSTTVISSDCGGYSPGRFLDDFCRTCRLWRERFHKTLRWSESSVVKWPMRSLRLMLSVMAVAMSVVIGSAETFYHMTCRDYGYLGDEYDYRCRPMPEREKRMGFFAGKFDVEFGEGFSDEFRRCVLGVWILLSICFQCIER